MIHPYTYNEVIAAQKGRTEYYNTLFVSGAGDEIWLSGYSQSGVLHIWGNGQFEHILTPYTLYFAVTQFGDEPRYSYIKRILLRLTRGALKLRYKAIL